jgi:Bacteriophage HK97-gp10, putative tail-component
VANTGLVGFRIDSRRPGALKIDGLREVQRDLRKLSDATKREMKSTHQKAAEIIVGESKKYVPIRTGALANSIRAAATMTGGRVRVGSASVPYAGPIHFGWPARRIKPQPFIYEALDPRRNEIAQLYAERISQLIVKYDLADSGGAVSRAGGYKSPVFARYNAEGRSGESFAAFKTRLGL